MSKSIENSHAASRSRPCTTILLLGILPLLAGACASDTVEADNTADARVGARSESIRQVDGAADDRALAWRLEPQWQVGGATDGQLLLVRLFAKDLATDDNGNLFVVDRTQNQVVVYDRSGARVRTYGRKGMGLGELSAAVSVDVAPDGSVRVDDVEKNAVVVFAPDGSILPEDREGSRLRFPHTLTGGARVGTRYLTRDTVSLVVAADSSLTSLITFAEPQSRSTSPVCGLTEYPAGPIFAPELIWAARGSRVVAATGEFRITVFEDSVPLVQLTRSAPLRRSSGDLARQHLGPGETFQLFGMPPCTVPTDLILSVAEVARELPAYSALTIAPDGRIWATRYTVRGEPGAADVYHAERGYEGTVALGEARPAVFLSSGELVSLETDGEGVPLLVVYRVDSVVGMLGAK